MWLKRRMGRALTVIAVFGVTIALLLARAPDAVRAPQFWAEDAVIFWLQQYERGFLAALLVPSAGYLHVVPRLIAAIADWLPYPMHPAAFVTGAAVVTGWTAATIAGLALPLPLAASLGVVALLAVPGGETLTNPTNVQWIMAPALPLIAAAVSPAGRFARANQLAFVALSGLSGPFSILMIPIWLWRVWSGARRDRLALALAATTLLAGIAQAIVLVLVGAPEILDGPPDLLRALWMTLRRAVTEPFGANNGIRTFLIASVGLLVAAVRGDYAQHRRVCMAFAGLVLLAVAWKWRPAPGWLGVSGYGDRYFQISAVMIAFCAVTLLFEKGIARLIGVVGCLVLAQHAGKRFVRAPIPDFSEQWAAISAEVGTRPLQLRVPPDWILRIPPRPPFSAGSR
jgi:hypothetical protein